MVITLTSSFCNSFEIANGLSCYTMEIVVKDIGIFLTCMKGAEDAMEPPRTRQHRRYMPGLDGLRVVAVLSVIVYHSNSNWLPGGFLGVAIFFTLSGYLITDILAGEWEKYHSFNLKTFWIRRARRLLPAMLTVVAAVVLVSMFLDSSRLGQLRGDVPAALVYMSNWWLIFHKVSYFESFGPPSPLGHLWSLAVEEQFYLIWPLLLLLGFKAARSRKTLTFFILGLALVSALLMSFLYVPGSDPSRVYYGTDTRGFALLIGAVLAVIWPSQKLKEHVSGPARAVLEIVGIACLLSLLFLIRTQNEYDPFLYEGGLLIVAVLSAVLIAALAHPAGRLGKWLGAKPLRWLGCRSYGLYLWHYPVITLTTSQTAAENAEPFRLVWQLAITVLLAALSYKYIEEPIRRYGFQQAFASCFTGKIETKGRKLFPACAALALFAAIFAGCLNLYGVSAHSAPSVQSAGDSVSGEQSVTMPEIHGVAPAGPAQPVPAAPSSGEQNVNPGAPKPTPTPPSAAPSHPATASPGNGTAAAGNGKTKPKHETDGDATDGNGVTAVGDSVMLDIEPYLQKALPKAVIDGKVGRQMAEAPELLDQLDQKGQLGDIVIVELGTNGAFSKSKFNKLLDQLKDVSHILLVNTRVPRPWEQQVNRMLSDKAEEDSRITLIDWYAASSGKSSYFEKDGVHLKPEGAKAYAALLIDALAKLTP